MLLLDLLRGWREIEILSREKFFVSRGGVGEAAVGGRRETCYSLDRACGGMGFLEILGTSAVRRGGVCEKIRRGEYLIIHGRIV